MLICHRCDVPLCVNPDHLFLGTASENMKDMWIKGRHKSPTEGVIGSHSAKLTLEQVSEIRVLLQKKHKQREIAQRYGVSQAAISALATGRNWGRYV